MTGCIVVTCAAPTRANADRIADALVGRRIAACVQISAIESVYRWQGAVCRDPETLLTIKTTAARLDAIRAAIAELHDHGLPEIAATAIVGGSDAYLRWIEESVAL